MRQRLFDEAGVLEKFGVPPASIPDWLALVGDTADGIPGIPRWGAKSAAAVLRRFSRIEAIPDDASRWGIAVRGAAALAESLAARREEAALFKRLATLRADVPLAESLSDLEWKGARHESLWSFCREIGDDNFAGGVSRFRD
jgi:5'-3' exonuclease